MYVPAFSEDGMNGTHRRSITKYGTSKYNLEKVSRQFCREIVGPWHREHINTKSHSRWHSSEGNYKESRDSSDATLMWERKSTCKKSQKSYRSRSRSPAHRFGRARVNDRSDRTATYNFTNDRKEQPRRTSTISCKFFATGKCLLGSYCRFSHNDWTPDRFSNYKPDEHMQGIDSRVYMAPPRVSDINVSPFTQDESEGLGEQRAIKSFGDDNAATENSFIAHRIDSDDPTRKNGRIHLSLTAHSSSEMGVSESRGTASGGADREGSITYTENHLLTHTFAKPDVVNTVPLEAAASDQCRLRNEQISRLTNTVARLLKDGKRLPELYAALSSSNVLAFIQSSVSDFAGPDVPVSPSNQYDPVTDSLELVKSVISEEQDGILLTPQLLLTSSPGGDGLYRMDCKKAELNVNSLQSSKKALSADCKSEKQSILTSAEIIEGNGGGKLVNNEGVGKAAEIKKNFGNNLQTGKKASFPDCKNQEDGIVKVKEIEKGQDRGKLINNVGDGKAGVIEKKDNGKSLRAFKFSLAEFVKELLCPTWKDGQIKKEAYKTIVKNVVDKVIASVQSIYIPDTKEKINKYLAASKPKILKLLQAYTEKFKEENSNIA